MLIGISGKKQSGKNTVARIWQLLDTWHNDYFYEAAFWAKHGKANTDIEYAQKGTKPDLSIWKQKAFATKLKAFACSLFGCTLKDLENEEFKNSYLPLENSSITYRQFLQIVGTKLMRECIHPQIWIESLLKDYIKCINNKETPNWLITDCRFPEECNKIINLGGFIIRTNKITDIQDTHESEIALDNHPELFKYTIDNTGSMEDLITQVKAIMIAEHIIPKK